jgi:tetratricopeptide (TPR) repeat protein
VSLREIRTQAIAPRDEAGRGFRPAYWFIPAAWIYFALVGGTGPGELQPVLRLVNSAFAIGLLLAWLRAVPKTADTLDRYTLLSLLLFLGPAVMARSPRAAFDAALGASAYVALLFVARSALADQVVSVRVARWLGVAGVVIAATYCALWLLVWSRWLGAGQPAWGIFDLPLPAGPYGFKHNLALVSGLLIPFLWIVPADRLGRPMRAVGIAILALVLLMAGSRGLWLAGVAATATITAMRWRSMSDRMNLRRGWWIPPLAIALLMAAVAMWLAPDLLRAIGGRVGNLLTVGMRWDLWSASLREWSTAPITGVGPGGWPIWLPTTGYFDGTTLSPSHPDSMPFQLIAELGLFGVAAVVAMVVGVAHALRRTPPVPAIWVAVFFLVACLTANPTDLPFAVALAVAWMAIAVPRATDGNEGVSNRTMRTAHVAALAPVVAFVVVASWAGLLHEKARAAVGGGDLQTAASAMETAVALDPGVGLYRRELAALRLADDDLDGAVVSLERARAINPADDINLAALAIAWSLQGRDEDAIAAANRAVALRGSAPINHVVLAWVAARANRPLEVSSALADSLVAAPWLSADGGWQALRGDLGAESILRSAAVRSASNLYGMRSGNAAWLAAMIDRPDLAALALDAASSNRETLGAVVAILNCDATGADELIAQAANTDAASLYHWLVAAMVRNASGRSSSDAVKIASLLGSTATLTTAALTGDVPSSASAFSPRADDQWVYDRIPILLRDIGPRLPSDTAGLSQWLTAPRISARTGAPGSRLAECDG